MNQDKMAPLHPGEVLLTEFLAPLGMSQNRLAMAIRVPARRINEIVMGKRRSFYPWRGRVPSILPG